MSTSPYSLDLREKVIQFLSKGNSQKLASTIFNIHENTISRWNVRKTREGTIAPKARLGPRSKVDKQELEDFVRNNPNMRLQDIGKNFGISRSQTGRILKELGFSYKKKPFSYLEASAEKRSEYLEMISKYDKEQIVHLDESGIDMSICLDRGWGKIGELLVGQKSGKQYQRTNIIAGLVNNKPIASFVFNGTCNTELFNDWVEKFLIKELKAGQVVVMDNASFHKSQKTKELIESVDCTIIFLPPYSPDLNPIEKFWANMKRWIKNKVTETSKLFEIIAMFFAT
jgi:transposase